MAAPTRRIPLRSTQRRARDERGAVLIITAICMVAMMCFAGLAVDMGSVRAQRAQYQATADAAALFATYRIRQPGADLATVAADVRRFVALNLDQPGGTTDAAWRNCTDAKHLPTTAPQDTAIGNQCISFVVNGGSSQARVRLPVLEVEPVFGLGLVSMPVTAVAGAEGTGAGCDSFGVGGCGVPTTTTTVAPTTTRAPSPTTTRAPSPTTTRPPSPTTTRAPSPTTTRAPSPTTTRAPSPTTTRAPSPTTTRAPVTTTTRPPTPTTIDIGS